MHNQEALSTSQTPIASVYAASLARHRVVLTVSEREADQVDFQKLVQDATLFSIRTAHDLGLDLLAVVAGAVGGALDGIAKADVVTAQTVQDAVEAAIMGVREAGGDVAEAARAATEGALMAGKLAGVASPEVLLAIARASVAGASDRRSALASVAEAVAAGSVAAARNMGADIAQVTRECVHGIVLGALRSGHDAGTAAVAALKGVIQSGRSAASQVESLVSAAGTAAVSAAETVSQQAALSVQHALSAEIEGMRIAVQAPYRWLSLIHSHPALVAPKPKGLWAADEEAIVYIKDLIEGPPSIMAAEIGCGPGRYSSLLLRHFGQPLFLYCVDADQRNLTRLKRYLLGQGHSRFAIRKGSPDLLPLQDSSLDCVFAFTGVHDIPMDVFLDETRRVLKPGGTLFLYTSWRSQRARSIWGKYFPGFVEMDSRHPEREEFAREARKAPGLSLELVRNFRYSRLASVENLLAQARRRKDPTLALYGLDEMEAAIAEFARRLARVYQDSRRVSWHEEKVLLGFEKAG